MSDPVTQVPAHVLDYLAAHRTLSLATASADGSPHASTMLYASDGSSVYIWARRQTTTAKHIEENPRVAFTIDDVSGDWHQGSGVQGTGSAAAVEDGGQVVNLIGLFADKFSQSVGEDSAAGITFYKITPTQLRFIGGSSDNAAEPVGAQFSEEDL
jgi:nitroimidazol reductase NimA-like FMN-containing flavoprotein (pyridoxamine 5'-phosphate oxidase superfamily)